MSKNKELFNMIAEASENPNEGLEAGKYIQNGPNSERLAEMEKKEKAQQVDPKELQFAEIDSAMSTIKEKIRVMFESTYDDYLLSVQKLDIDLNTFSETRDEYIKAYVDYADEFANELKEAYSPSNEVTNAQEIIDSFNETLETGKSQCLETFNDIKEIAEKEAKEKAKVQAKVERQKREKAEREEKERLEKERKEKEEAERKKKELEEKETKAQTEKREAEEKAKAEKEAAEAKAKKEAEEKRKAEEEEKRKAEEEEKRKAEEEEKRKAEEEEKRKAEEAKRKEEEQAKAEAEVYSSTSSSKTSLPRGKGKDLSYDDISLVLTIYDYYEQVPDKVAENIRTHFAGTDDKASVVQKILRTDRYTYEAIKKITEVIDMSSAERAFALMELNDDILTSMKKVLKGFESSDMKENRLSAANKINFCRELEYTISFLDKNAREYFVALNEFLVFPYEFLNK